MICLTTLLCSSAASSPSTSSRMTSLTGSTESSGSTISEGNAEATTSRARHARTALIVWGLIATICEKRYKKGGISYMQERNIQVKTPIHTFLIVTYTNKIYCWSLRNIAEQFSYDITRRKRKYVWESMKTFKDFRKRPITVYWHHMHRAEPQKVLRQVLLKKVKSVSRSPVGIGVCVKMKALVCYTGHWHQKVTIDLVSIELGHHASHNK